MTSTDYTQKLDELDRLLNDPDVPMQPDLIWRLLDEVAQSETTDRGEYMTETPIIAIAIPACFGPVPSISA